MDKFKFVSKNNIQKLPEIAGVYSFKGKRAVLYIGKAANIKNRVKNHFQQPSHRDDLFWEKIEKVGYITTDSEIEALILEADLIKKIQPKFNVMWKDSKNYFYVAIAEKEKKPWVFITHQPVPKSQIPNPPPTGDLPQGDKSQINSKFKIQNSKTLYIGPFVDGKSLKQTLRILRRIFPFYSAKNHPKNLCPYCHLGLCPGPELFENPPSPKSSAGLREYKTSIKNLIAFLKGEKKSVLKNIKKEMFLTSKSRNFEKAASLRNKIFHLEKVLANSRIINGEPKENWENTEKILRKISNAKTKIQRIEGYDISNIQGKEATGSMVVFKNGSPSKNDYRKFRIKTLKTPNDVGMLKEVLKRRFNHPEWQYPDLVLIDGGNAQLNIAINSKIQNLPLRGISRRETNVKSNPKSKNIRILSLAKKNNDLYIEGKKKPVPLKNLPQEINNLILYIRDESHRFAKKYHSTLRKNNLFETHPVRGRPPRFSAGRS